MSLLICDTCSIFMLLRINPKMFTNKRFNCITTKTARKEIIETSRFKDRYPWRKEYSGNIRTIPTSHDKKEETEIYKEAISALHWAGTINIGTEKIFDLSRVDQELLAWSLALKIPVITSDVEINYFGIQQFPEDFEGIISPLHVLNNWIDEGLIEWNDTCQAYLEDWQKKSEPPQPGKEKTRFRRLTGYRYVGS